MSATALQTRWTVDALEGVIVELLAGLLVRDPDDLLHELQGKGAAMPVDSLDMFDIVHDFRKRTGLKLPVKELGKGTLRSVRSFAEFAARSAAAS